jgi:hypothetical protein
MAIRFRKSFKVAPGIRLNVSKSGLSTSIGGKGVTANLSKKGTRVTTSIPGSGLSASKLYASKQRQQPEEAPSRAVGWVMLILLALLVAAWITA